MAMAMDDKASPKIDGHVSGGIDIHRIMQTAENGGPSQPPAKGGRWKKKQQKTGNVSTHAEKNANGAGVTLSDETRLQSGEKAGSTNKGARHGKEAARKKHQSEDCATDNASQGGGKEPKYGSEAAGPGQDCRDRSAVPKKKNWNGSATKNRHAEDGKEGGSSTESNIHLLGSPTHTKPSFKKKKNNGCAKNNSAQIQSGEQKEVVHHEENEAIPVHAKPVPHKKKKWNSSAKDNAKKKKLAEGLDDEIPPTVGISKPSVQKKQDGNSHSSGIVAQLLIGKGGESKEEEDEAVPVHAKPVLQKKKKWNSIAKGNAKKKSQGVDDAIPPIVGISKSSVLQKNDGNGHASGVVTQLLNGKEGESKEEEDEVVPVHAKPVPQKKKKWNNNAKGNAKKKEPAEGFDDSIPPVVSISKPSVMQKQDSNNHPSGIVSQLLIGKGGESKDEDSAVAMHAKPFLHKKKKKNGSTTKVVAVQLGKEKESTDEVRGDSSPPQSKPAALHKPVLQIKQNRNDSARSNIAGRQNRKGSCPANTGHIEDPPRQGKPFQEKQNSNNSVGSNGAQTHIGKGKELMKESGRKVSRCSKPGGLEKNGLNGSTGSVSQKTSRNEEGATDEGDVVVVTSRGQAVMLKKTGHEGGATPSEHPETTLLKKRLFEATSDLEKERNTREMLENRLRSLGRELKLVKEKLGGEDKHFCIGTLHEELQSEKTRRISAQNDLERSNEKIAEGQTEIKMLSRQLEAEKEATCTVEGELRAAKEELAAEMVRQDPLEAELGAERRKNKDLQRRLQYEAAASVAIRMELRSLKGKADETAKLAEELTKERSASVESHYEVKKLARPPLTLHDKTDAERDRLVRRLRKELHLSKAQLKHERQKHKQEMARPAKQERQKHEPAARLQKKCPQRVSQRSLSDWVPIVAPTNAAQHAGLIPILQSPPSTNMPPPVETSLPGLSRAETVSSGSAETEPPPLAHESLFHFEDDDVSVAGDTALEPLHDELTFLQSAYDPDEILFEDKKVTNFVELATWYDTDTVTIAIACILPDDYPAAGVLNVKATIQSSNCSHRLRKCAVDALPLLEEICTMEARANEGKESIHPVFSVASGWAHTDWYNLLSKELSIADDAREDSERESAEVCVALIHTHHLREADKIQIQSIKKNASKLSLGGFVKIGKPGLILIEGNDTDCNQFLDTLTQSKKVFHSSTFRVGGRALRKASDTEDRHLPRKMGQLESKSGMDELSRVCEELGLLQALHDIIS